MQCYIQRQELSFTDSHFDRQVNVLRDTGCTAVVMKRDLVPDERLTGRMIGCVLIDGTVRRTPTSVLT